MSLVGDQETVEEFTADRTDEAFGDRVRPRRPNRCLDDLDVDRGKHGQADGAGDSPGGPFLSPGYYSYAAADGSRQFRWREWPVARFVTFFSYTSEAWARLLDNPGDRSGPVGATIADAGGRLVSLDYLFGERDGMAVFEAPDSATAAAVALVIGGSGAFRSVATHELVPSAELVDVLRTAAAARPGYARPGE